MRTLISLFIIAFPATLLPMDAAYDYVVKPALNVGEYALPLSGTLRNLIAPKKVAVIQPSNRPGYLAQQLIGCYASGLATTRTYGQLGCYGAAMLPEWLQIKLGATSHGFITVVPTPLSLVWSAVCRSKTFNDMVVQISANEFDTNVNMMCIAGIGKNILGHLTQYGASQSAAIASVLDRWQSIHEPYAPDLTDSKWRKIIAGVYGTYIVLSCFERYVLKKRARRYTPL